MSTLSHLKYVYHHVFYPPKLPQSDDTNPEALHALHAILQNVLVKYTNVIGSDDTKLRNCYTMLENFRQVRQSDGSLITGHMESMLHGDRISNGKPLSKASNGVDSDSLRPVMVLEIRAQNAGVIVSAKAGKSCVFELFELSADCASVMAAEGRLRRSYPGSSIEVANDRLDDPAFRTSLIEALCKMDSEYVNETVPQISKASTAVPEIRDTVHPRLVTELIREILRAVGQDVQIPVIQKHSRDDVLWRNSLTPWRRSPTWQVLRLSIQRCLLEDKHGKQNSDNYKSFMVYLLAQILELSARPDITLEIRQVMRMKIARRLLKIKPDGSEPWLSEVERILRSTHMEDLQRWRQLEELTDPHRTLGELALVGEFAVADTVLSLHSLHPYLDSVMHRTPNVSSGVIPSVKLLQRTSIRHESLPAKPQGEQQVMLALWLRDVEHWVDHHLEDWSGCTASDGDAAIQLADLIHQYQSTALAKYKSDPMDFSLMCLTLMELWVEMDRRALRAFPLMQDFSCEWTHAMLQPLLVPKYSQMERLRKIEQYLTKRGCQLVPCRRSMFSGIMSDAAFAVKFYNISSAHQDLRRKIEKSAQRERDQKISELAQKKSRHNTLLRESNQLQCTYIEVHRHYGYVEEHSPQCPKCRLKNEAAGLEIFVHEWPLPAKEHELKAAIFELDVPSVIQAWRRTTYSMKMDVFAKNSLESGGVDHVHQLLTYEGLRRWARTPQARFGLASPAKPFVLTHYKKRKISVATEQSVCVAQGMHLALYDLSRGQLTSNLGNEFNVRPQCTFKLSCGAYHNLQDTLSGTLHTSNEIIARQTSCDPRLTLHEFYAFGDLRAGERIQLYNIARELASAVLNFTHEEVLLLFQQAIWQAGSSLPEAAWRQAHAPLAESPFTKDLLSVMKETFTKHETNWQGTNAVRLMAVLTQRLLSLSPHEKIRTECLAFLKKIRRTTLTWTRKLDGSFARTSDNDERSNISRRLIAAAMVSLITFDTETSQYSSVLASSDDAAEYCECLIMLNNHTPRQWAREVDTMLSERLKVAQLLEWRLQELITADAAGLNAAIKIVWSDFLPYGSWQPIDSKMRQWLQMCIPASEERVARSIHFNTLSGELLIDGLPLSRLPRTVTEHITFERLFGKQILDVAPSSMHNMQFMSKRDICGHKVHFRLEGQDLIIRSEKSGAVHELIPISHLEGDFPHAMIHEYFHWFDLRSQHVEWRPRSQPWSPSSDEWKLVREDEGYVLKKGSLSLIDIRSDTARILSGVLTGLEVGQHMITTYDLHSRTIHVRLPRMQLDFTTSKALCLLASKQFPGTVVDENQTFGTLTGLCSSLVLRSNDRVSRKVIIPFGRLQSTPLNDHVKTTVLATSAGKITYMVYDIDIHLGRLVGDQSTLQRIYKSYLHAMTSSCFPDLLTGRTGTEEALAILAQASMHSFTSLGEAEKEVLGLIASLTPQREYYPKKPQVMQKVRWNKSLSIFSQHPRFRSAVEEILAHEQILNIFGDSRERSTSLPTSDAHLLIRGAQHDALIRVCDFGAEIPRVTEDYRSRDTHEHSTGIEAAYTVSKLVDEWSTKLRVSDDLFGLLKAPNRAVRGSASSDLVFGYDALWLEPVKIDIPKYWCSLQTLMSGSNRDEHKYRIMFLLATMAYSPRSDLVVLETLLAFATVVELTGMRPPPHPVFDIKHGYEPKRQVLVELIKSAAFGFHTSPQASLPKLPHENKKQYNARRRTLYDQALHRIVNSIVDHFLQQWPRAKVIRPDSDQERDQYVNVEIVISAARQSFTTWFHNRELRDYAFRAQKSLSTLRPGIRSYTPYQIVDRTANDPQTRSYLAWDRLFHTGNLVDDPRIMVAKFPVVRRHSIHNDTTGIDALVQRALRNGHNSFQKQYLHDFQKSIRSLERLDDIALTLEGETPLSARKDLMSDCAQHVQQNLLRIKDLLKSQLSRAEFVTTDLDLGPRLGISSLLKWLTLLPLTPAGRRWTAELMCLAIDITRWQQSYRLVACGDDTQAVIDEVTYKPHQNWNPLERPEWMLLQLEGNFLIRPQQVDIAEQMISPNTGRNTAMQLNMGEGKSSVIVPMVAATAANKKQLVRIIVLKQLANAMLEILACRLGGLLGRRIVFLPFSRSVKLTTGQFDDVRRLLDRSMKSGDVMLAQPEHILSFELYGPERCLREDNLEGVAAINLQGWLDDHVRDILDESDELLNPKYQLIYTIGLQKGIDLQPDRWILIGDVLNVLASTCIQVVSDFTGGLVINPADQGQFPHLYVIDRDTGQLVVESVVDNICSNGLPSLRLDMMTKGRQQQVRRYITELRPGKTIVANVNKITSHDETLKKKLLVLRGLFAHQVLQFAFHHHRWRVTYGLSLDRSMLAVPFRAKDQPTPRSEFSHPDLTIILTSLSYYYYGLNDAQLRLTFETLIHRDDPESEYHCWVCHLPATSPVPRQLAGVNIEDKSQWVTVIFPSLRRLRLVVDFYMFHHVFPQGMREFPYRLSASGWNLAKERPGRPTTGFSGTNDSRFLLPLSIEQNDLPQQKHTNALVLKHLLQTENSVLLMEREGTDVSRSQAILRAVTSSECTTNVLIDVGAQMLEMDNRMVAKTWLAMLENHQAQAAVFFDDNDVPMVIDRLDIVEALGISPFARQFDRCVFYLDDIHTRGTDFRFPRNFRAAVTLTRDLTKDRLVQACMRMRKLGAGHSIVFLVTHDTLQNIRSIVERLGEDGCPEIEDILEWTIKSSCANIARLGQLWARQGIAYKKYKSLYEDCCAATDSVERSRFIRSMQEDECQTLAQRYNIRSNICHPDDGELCHDNDQIADRLASFAAAGQAETTLHEQEEKELAPENEEERQMERPAPVSARIPYLDPEVADFVKTGCASLVSGCFRPAFQALQHTKLKHHDLTPWTQHNNLLVTRDFVETVKATDAEDHDWYVKAVKWVACSCFDGQRKLVVFSPFEANELLPHIRASTKTSLGIYAARTSMSARSLEDLDFCMIGVKQPISGSPRTMPLLNLFAGQTCLSSFTAYRSTCLLLGLVDRKTSREGLDDFEIFIPIQAREKFDSEMAQVCLFLHNPLPVVRALLELRRKGHSFAGSHLGMILQGKTLSSEDWGLTDKA